MRAGCAAGRPVPPPLRELREGCPGGFARGILADAVAVQRRQRRVRRGWRQAIAALLGGELVTRVQHDRVREISRQIELLVVGFVGFGPQDGVLERMVDLQVRDLATGSVDSVRLGVGDTYQTRIAVAMRLEELRPLG